MPRSMELARFLVLCGMGEFPLRPQGFSGIFTAHRYNDGTALMPVVTCQDQLPLPVVRTFQDKHSPPDSAEELLPVKVWYKFIVPDAPNSPPSDWY